MSFLLVAKLLANFARKSNTKRTQNSCLTFVLILGAPYVLFLAILARKHNKKHSLDAGGKGRPPAYWHVHFRSLKGNELPPD